MDSVVNLPTIVIGFPLWSVVTGLLTITSASFLVGWHAFRVKQAVQDNIVQNNLNHQKQMELLAQQAEVLERLLKKIICLTRVQLKAIGNPKFRYNQECEDEE